MADDLPPTQPPLDDGEIVTVDIEDEVQRSYLDYAMSVIVGRALPDVRDGLKPVHRRLLWGMENLGARPGVQHMKCARVTGEVMGKYHPHGDQAIYDALARMAQDFAMRHVLVDGKGNFGSVDGDPPAASRYTECRLAPLAMELLRDIDEDTVDMIANYDGREEEPVILPARFPNLLVNGSTGIAVGMATNIPPHNLGEVIDATVALLDNPELVGEDLMKIIKGPDFPGGGSILGITGIKDAFETGRGSVRVRGKAEVEESKRGQRIVITQLPYMVSGDRLLEKIHELLEAKRITGISNGRNESNRKGIRIVLELKRDAIPQVVLNNLYKFTQLQDSFGINMLALVDGVPRTLPLVEILRAYINHQVAVITRRTRFRLRKAEDRMHTLMGLLVALDQLDAIITLIRQAESAEAARSELMARAWEVSAETAALLERAGASAAQAAAAVAESGQEGEATSYPAELRLGLDGEGRFHLSERQATAILDMALRRLAGLERQNLRDEATELAGTIAELRAILDSPAKLRRIIRDELVVTRDKFANPRRTQIIADEGEIDIEDLIPDDEVVVTITRSGYVKRTKSAIYKIQGRGGKGVIGAKPKEGDIVSQMLATTNHAFMLVFSSRGKVYRIKAHEIP
ncbi:MAG: DNA topoisomerase (ATP-hydrolyzing), partial [Actinomycetota bacterium]